RVPTKRWCQAAGGFALVLADRLRFAAAELGLALKLFGQCGDGGRKLIKQPPVFIGFRRITGSARQDGPAPDALTPNLALSAICEGDHTSRARPAVQSDAVAFISGAGSWPI